MQPPMNLSHASKEMIGRIFRQQFPGQSTTRTIKQARFLPATKRGLGFRNMAHQQGINEISLVGVCGANRGSRRHAIEFDKIVRSALQTVFNQESGTYCVHNFSAVLFLPLFVAPLQ